MPNTNRGPGLEHDASSRQVLYRSDASSVNVEVEQPADEASEKPEDVPPDGGYGWVCTGCNFFINAHTWGITSVSKPCQPCCHCSLMNKGSHMVSSFRTTLLRIPSQIHLRLHTLLSEACLSRKLIL